MSDDPSRREPATPTDPAVYQAQVGTDFSIDASPAPVVLRLASVDDRGPTSGLHQFSLFFHGAPDRFVPQGTYVFDHDALGPLLLFIAPVQGSTRERILYEACFNVRVETPGPD
jgi:hypothetical protein